MKIKYTEKRQNIRFDTKLNHEIMIYDYKFETGYERAESALIIIAVQDDNLYAVGKEYELDVKNFLNAGGDR